VTSETTPSPQGASTALVPSLPLLEGTEATQGQLALPEELGPYLECLAANLTDWQHRVFNAAQCSKNRVGMTHLANEIQVAAYEVRILLGYSEVEAKKGAKIPLSLEEMQAEAVKDFQKGLHPRTAPTVYLPQGRRADRSD
jgi:hypothetical protein